MSGLVRKLMGTIAAAAVVASGPSSVPVALFAGGEVGDAWIVHEDYLFTDTAGTVQVTTPGDRIACWTGAKYGTQLTQPVSSTRRPMYARLPPGGWDQQFLKTTTPSNSLWVKTNVSITTGQTDSDGGTGAWLVQSTAGSVASNIAQNVSRPAADWTLSAIVKAGNVNRVILGMTNTSGFSDNIFDTVSGTWVLTSGSVTRDQVDLGGGWWLISISCSSNEQSPGQHYIGPINNSGTAFNSTTSGNNIYVYHFQLQPGLSVATFQDRDEIYSAPTSGDSVAGVYWPGTFDQNLYSGSLNFSSTQQITVFLNFEKVSKPGDFGAIVEFGNNPASDNGTFTILQHGNSSSAKNPYFGCRSTALYERYLTQSTNVVSRFLANVKFDLGAGSSAIAASVKTLGSTYTALTTATGTNPGTAGGFNSAMPVALGNRLSSGGILRCHGFMLGALVIIGRLTNSTEDADMLTWQEANS
jgi:hypothetical protein